MSNIIKPKRGGGTPGTGDLVDGEIAIDTTNRKLYTKISGAIQEISAANSPAGSNTQVQFNNNGAFGASANFTFNSGTNALVVTGTIEATVQIDAPHFKGSLLGSTQQQCRNDTVSTITKGTPVYITGYSNNRVLIAPAEAGNSAKMPAVGLLDSDIAASSNGHYTILGVAKNLNTTGYQVNETLYVGTNGGLTNVRPTGATTLIQNIGKVVDVGANGEILVMGPGRSNDVPNTITARTGLYTNDANGIRLYDLDSSNYLRLRPADTLANDINFILPADVGIAKQVLGIQSVVGKSATLDWQSPAYLSDAQSFTAKQTFTNGLEANAGTFTGNITLQNSEFIRNSTDGRIDLMPNGTTSTHFGIYFDTTGWGFGTQIGTIRASDGLLNTGGSILWNSNLVIAADTDFSIGSNSAYRIRNSSTGNDTLQIALAGGAYTSTNSNSLALVDVNGIGAANRSPATNHTNPNLYVYRNGTASANDFIRMEHDGTDGALYSGGSTNIALSPGSGTVKVNNKLTLGTSALNSSVGGCLEYDGKVLYGNAASGRGVIPVMQISSVATTKSLNSATGDQNIFDTPQDVITLAANTTYIIRGYLILNTGTTTARNLFLRFIDGISANPPTIHFATVGMPSTGGAAARAQDTAFFNTTNGGQITQTTFTNNNYNAWITGVIKTVDSVTITPKIAFSAAPGNTNTVGFGTYIAFIPVGSDTLASVGPWS